jgi:hypothetical protein
MKSNNLTAAIQSVRSELFPYDYYHDLYQRYYREGIYSYLSELGTEVNFHRAAHFPKALRFIGHIRDARKIQQIFGPFAGAIKTIADGLAWSFGARERAISATIGQYIFYSSRGQINVCIDSADSGKIENRVLLSKSNIFFKTNYNVEYSYEEKVLPFYNCNPMIIDHIKTLQAMRGSRHKYDICFVVRVWGGEDEIEGIEHCMRLLEWVSKARGNKFILAYLVAGEKKKLAARLRKIGIPSTSKPMAIKQLWEIAAQSRINIIRLGMHQCIPWRMSELMALGACPVFDQNIKTLWPILLDETNNYFSLNASTFSNRLIASDDCYKAIPEMLEHFLGNESHRREMSKNNEEYFDSNMHPKAVGRQICDEVIKRACYGIDTNNQ